MAAVPAPPRPRARRPGWRRRRVVAVAGFIILVAAMYMAAFAYLNWRADRRYRAEAAEVDRLDPGWRLDDLLARRRKVPDEVNSALRVQALAGRLPALWPGVRHYQVWLWQQRPEVRLDPAQVADLKAVFESAAEFAPAARALADFPVGNYEGPRPMVERSEQVGQLNAYRDVHFPYGEDVRRVGLLLRLDATLHAEDGDLATALADARAMINVGRSVGDYPGQSAQMVRFGLVVPAIGVIERILAQGEARADDLAGLQALLEDEDGHPMTLIALRGERAIADDLLQQIRAGKLGVGAIPRFSDYPWLERAFTTRRDLREDQARVLRFYTRVVEIGKLSEGEQVAAMEALTGEYQREAITRGFWERSRHLAERLLRGRAFGMPLWSAIDRATLRTAIAGLAAERYRLDRGRWPETLDQLVPDYLAAVPADPFADGSLKLRRLPDGLFVYSVGRDRRDDGGTIDWVYRGADRGDLGFVLRDVPARRRPPDRRRPADEVTEEAAPAP